MGQWVGAQDRSASELADNIALKKFQVHRGRIVTGSETIHIKSRHTTYGVCEC
jgi:hypothetical protein